MSPADDRAPNEGLDTRPARTCYLCGSEGTPLYAGLPDRSCGAPGLWDFKRCPNDGCALVWLDPRPAEGDIGKAYRNYYTHKSFSRPSEGTAAARALLAAYLAVDGLASRVTGLAALKRRADVMYLDGAPAGRLLDVGCGDGAFLARMRRLGWSVEGVEVDPEAADNARATHGLVVHPGPLESLRFPDGTFDAIAVNHVIEHVFDPVALLKECRRILRPGGRLRVVTPNTKSLGHRIFGKDWHHLDPPRHLHLFSRGTLRECAGKAGFGTAGVWCTPANADAALPDSVFRQASGGNPERLRSRVSRTSRVFFLKYYELLRARKDPDAGEEVVLAGEKMACCGT